MGKQPEVQTRLDLFGTLRIVTRYATLDVPNDRIPQLIEAYTDCVSGEPRERGKHAPYVEVFNVNGLKDMHIWCEGTHIYIPADMEQELTQQIQFWAQSVPTGRK